MWRYKCPSRFQNHPWPSPHPPPPPPPMAFDGVLLCAVGNLTQNETHPVRHLTFVSKRWSASLAKGFHNSFLINHVCCIHRYGHSSYIHCFVVVFENLGKSPLYIGFLDEQFHWNEKTSIRQLSKTLDISVVLSWIFTLEQMVRCMGKLLNSHWCMGDLTLFKVLTCGASACVKDITQLLLSPSGKQRQNPCSGSPAEYQDLSMCHDWPVRKAIVDFPMKMKQNLKCTFGNLLSPLGIHTICLITSRCSGNESVLLPWTDGWTYKCMSLLLSITNNQIVACSNPAGRITLCSWSRFQMVDAKVLFDVVCNRFKT